MKRYWTCPKGCGARNDRIKVKCATPGCAGRRPKKRVPRHAVTLRDDTYETYCAVNEAIHGVADESCAVCGRPRSLERRHDRDHDHGTGKPRGLACHRCNRVMVRELDLERARAIVGYLERVESHYRLEDAA